MTGDAQTVDVTYRGLKVATGARLVQSGPGVGFLEVEAPLPVGSRLTLSGPVTLEARVTGVVEQESGAKTVAGMRIAWGEPAAAARPASAPAKAVEPAVAPPVLPAGGTVETTPVARASDSASVTSPTAATVSNREASADAEPEPADSGSLGSPPDETTTTGGGEPRRRRRRKNASRS